MAHLERLAITTVLLAMAGQPVLAQSNTEWVGGEAGMVVHNTPSTADRAQVQADLAAARKNPHWDQRLREGQYPAEPGAAQGAADSERSRTAVKQELAAAVKNGVNLNPRPQ